MNITLQQKKELINELIHNFQTATYSKGRKQELVDQARAILQFIKPESVQNIVSELQGRATVRVIGLNAQESLKNEMARFESFKERSLSQFNALLTEVTLLEKFSDTTNDLPPREIPLKDKVFIVHGHDDGLKNEVARFVENQGLEAIILHELSNRGQTIIEKFEANSNVGFAIVLYTPCDLGRSASSLEEQSRARQNVVFEHGYFVAKLGRDNVVALNKGDVEVPNDLSGMIYTSYERDNWKRDIAHELSHSGYSIDFSKVR